MLVAVVFALVSSLLYALASVLQHRAAIAESPEHSLRIGLLVRLFRSPLWLAGIACDGLAYVLQFVALGHGSLVLVQPLLVCGLLFALPLGAWVAGTRMTAHDWSGAVAVVVGLALFLVVASPGKGSAEVSDRDWVILILCCAAAVATLVAAAHGRSNRYRAGLLAAAAGVTYGLTAALTKAAADLLSVSMATLLSSWEAYALVVGGAIGMVLAQSAFQAGPLDASLPVLTVVDPFVSIVIGAAVFGEGVRTGPLAIILECTGLALMTVGVFVLSRTEAVHAVLEDSPEPGPGQPGHR